MTFCIDSDQTFEANFVLATLADVEQTSSQHPSSQRPPETASAGQNHRKTPASSLAATSSRHGGSREVKTTAVSVWVLVCRVHKGQGNWQSCAGLGSGEIGSPPALECQKLNSRFLFLTHFLLCFSAICCSVFMLLFCVYTVVVCLYCCSVFILLFCVDTICLCLYCCSVFILLFCVYTIVLCLYCSVFIPLFCVYTVVLCLYCCSVSVLLFCVYTIVLCLFCCSVFIPLFCVYTIVLCLYHCSVFCCSVSILLFCVYTIVLCLYCSVFIPLFCVCSVVLCLYHCSVFVLLFCVCTVVLCLFRYTVFVLLLCLSNSFTCIFPISFFKRYHYLKLYHLVGLVVKASTLRAEGPWFNSRFCSGDFSKQSYTSNLKIGTPVATLPDAWF